MLSRRYVWSQNHCWYRWVRTFPCIGNKHPLHWWQRCLRKSFGIMEGMVTLGEEVTDWQKLTAFSYHITLIKIALKIPHLVEIETTSLYYLIKILTNATATFKCLVFLNICNKVWVLCFCICPMATSSFQLISKFYCLWL